MTNFRLWLEIPSTLLVLVVWHLTRLCGGNCTYWLKTMCENAYLWWWIYFRIENKRRKSNSSFIFNAKINSSFVSDSVICHTGSSVYLWWWFWDRAGRPFSCSQSRRAAFFRSASRWQHVDSQTPSWKILKSTTKPFITTFKLLHVL